MTKPAQSDPAIELAGRYVSSGANDGTVQRLKDSLDQIRLPSSRRPPQQEAPLFTAELQNDLLDINLPLAQDDDVWQDVRTPTFAVQDGLVVLYSGGLALECPKHLPFSGSFLHTPVPCEERAPVNRFNRLLGFLGLGMR